MSSGIKIKAFKSGNSVAVRLPKRFGVEAGAALVLEQREDEISIKRDFDPADYRRRLQAMFNKIEQVWNVAGGPPRKPMERNPDIFPDRPGLY